MKNLSYVREDCRLCGSRDLERGLSLQPTPVGDDYLAPERFDESQPLFPLDLYVCHRCGQVQLRDVVSPALLYSACSYTTSASPGFPEHLRAFTAQILEKYDVKPNSLVVEIGSNEGFMLKAFQEHHCRVVGVEPDVQLAERANAAGILSLGKFFTRNVAQEITNRHGRASILAASHELANIDDLKDVLDGVRDLLTSDGILIIESSYWPDVIGKGLLDTIYHEHLSYFSIAPLEKFFVSEGLEIIDVTRNSAKGGAIQLAAQLKGGLRKRYPSVSELIDLEQKSGFRDPAAFIAWSRRLNRISKQMRELLGNFKAEGKRIAGFGASVGTTTILYEMGVGPYIDGLVDQNPEKHGKRSPGLKIRCSPVEWIEESQADVVVVFAWRYFEKIRSLLKPFENRGGRFIIPLPELGVIGR